jgi:GLPGLI family protein
MKFLQLLILVLLLPVLVQAQSFEGKIVYSISYKDLPAEMQQMSSMLPGNQTIWIKGDKSRFEQSMAQGSTIVITDATEGSSTILMDVMGQKYKLAIPKNEMEAMISDQEIPEIKYVEGTREVAGYTCHKAEVKMIGFDDVATFYYTEEIPPVKVQGMEALQLKGMFMAYEFSANGMTMNIEVTNIDKGAVSDSQFNIPSGYVDMPDEMKAMMGLK